MNIHEAALPALCPLLFHTFVSNLSTIFLYVGSISTTSSFFIIGSMTTNLHSQRLKACLLVSVVHIPGCNLTLVGELWPSSIKPHG